MELLHSHVSTLDARLRAPLLADLANRFIGLEATPGYFLQEDALGRLRVFVIRLPQVCAAVTQEQQTLQTRFANFVRVYDFAASDAERRHAIVEYLRQFEPPRKQLRGDLKAFDKGWLDLDALRDRNDRKAAALGLLVDVALRVIASAVKSLATSRAELLLETAKSTQLELFLSTAALESRRWTAQVAALEALAALVECAQEHDVLNELDDRALASAARLRLDRERSPWTQVAALRLAAVTTEHRVGVLKQQLVAAPTGRTDMLVRRRALELAPELAKPADALELLRDPEVAQDPSEHVRQGVARAAAMLLPEAEALELLRSLAGLDAERPEPSAKVRAAAVLEALAALDDSTPTSVVDGIGALVSDYLHQESDPSALRLCCIAVAEVAWRPTPYASAAETWRTVVMDALLAVSDRADVAPAALEEAAATLESVSIALDPERRAWTERLTEITRALAPGKKRKLRSSKLARSLAPLPTDAGRWLGRLLAHISRHDYGLAMRLEGDRLTLWRGDLMRRRWWRMLHEVRNLDPGKRSDVLHTTGRVTRGDHRAPPGSMDEITLTNVPGERVFIEREGCWARHLPVVDDLLDVLARKRKDPLRIYSSYGVTTITQPESIRHRWLGRMRITRKYARLANLRLTCLESDEPAARGEYVRHILAQFGIRIELEPWPRPGGEEPRPVPAHVLQLFEARPTPQEPPHSADVPTAMTGGLLAAGGIDEWLTDWLGESANYFLSPTENSHTALTLFLAGLALVFFGGAWLRRRRLHAARAAIPLSVGGWGSRGKSGTERLKAGLFHGLGYEVFTKTTGCEAMFIQSGPGQPPIEFFIYRPYDKATIWEQADMLSLAAKLGAQVFTWECMALNPIYVKILQANWMRDDVGTITNAYPDHEDVMGPRGQNVAEVISCFLPRDGLAISSELNFHPLMAQVCRDNDVPLLGVPESRSELIADDVLDLFPYREHPRNIALVGRMAEALGIPVDVAIANMAEHVFPDLGVLRSFPAIRVAGRTLAFINGCSANERAGFLASWRRMGCDRRGDGGHLAEQIVTVINNRGDRVARSAVFARIIVGDVAADRHVVIGTNLRGLMGYVRKELDEHLAVQVIIAEADAPGDPEPARRRLGAMMEQLRIPQPDSRRALERLEHSAASVGHTLGEARGPLEQALEELLGPGDGVASARLTNARSAVTQAGLDRFARSALEPSEEEQPAREGPIPLSELATIEVHTPATVDEVVEAWTRHVTELVVRARLEAGLTRAVEEGSETAAARLRDGVVEAYRDVFLERFVLVDNPDATGDQIIEVCARSLGPGADIHVMGMQNIKGTGLDFVYRWVAMDKAVRLLEGLESSDPATRLEAIERLGVPEDAGCFDAKLVLEVLESRGASQMAADQRQALEQAAKQLRALHSTKKAALGKPGKRAWWARALDVVEAGVDFVDTIRRRRHAERIMALLAAGRISRARAALELRAVVSRGKGGWLAKSVAKRRAKARRAPVAG